MFFDLLLGGPPCQTFSTKVRVGNARRRRFNRIKSARAFNFVHNLNRRKRPLRVGFPGSPRFPPSYCWYDDLSFAREPASKMVVQTAVRAYKEEKAQFEFCQVRG